MDLHANIHKEHIHGILSCFDRVIITGTLPQISYAEGITSYLYNKGIRIFDYAKFAEPFRDAVRSNAEKFRTPILSQSKAQQFRKPTSYLLVEKQFLFR